LINGLSYWDYGNQLKEEYKFIICQRVNYQPEESNYPKNYRVLEGYLDASSTRIRDRINENLEKNNSVKLNLGINGLTTQSVISYIIKNQLYSLATATGDNNEKVANF
jgi:nicotinic acid mononucleotide adenylyltransferase